MLPSGVKQFTIGFVAMLLVFGLNLAGGWSDDFETTSMLYTLAGIAGFVAVLFLLLGIRRSLSQINAAYLATRR